MASPSFISAKMIMKHIIVLLLTLEFSSAIAQIDQKDVPWVKSRNSDTIYHTVVAVAKSYKDTVYRYYFLEDQFIKKDSTILPTTLGRYKQIDSIKRLKDSLFSIQHYATLTVSIPDSSIMVYGYYGSRKVHASSHKSYHRRRKKHYTKTTGRYIVRKTRKRAVRELWWVVYIDDDIGTIDKMEKFQGTLKQWDSIGRLYIPKSRK